MCWHDLLFLHWPVSPEVIRPLIPKGLELETFDGSAWIGIVPFRMSGVRPRYFPAGLAFPEINVRTYVWTPGRSGVWFFSLDASNRLVVKAAQLSYGLPYYNARISVRSDFEGIHYQSTRVDQVGAGAEFQASYKPTGPVYRSAPATLDRWLTDRYCLSTLGHAGRLGYAQIHHAPWPLQDAQARISTNTMAAAAGIALPASPPLLPFARRLDVLIWPFQRP